MKKPDEIRLGLKQCYTIGMSCNGCPYETYDECNGILAGDALAYIEQLEERIALMLIQMRGDCGCCKHKNASAFESPCNECTESLNRDLWEYEGLPELPKEEQK